MDGGSFNEPGVNALSVARINVLYERAGEAVFHAKQDADFLHAPPPGTKLVTSLRQRRQ
jgi:hypothetical protein